jgi:hypothetical protein
MNTTWQSELFEPESVFPGVLAVANREAELEIITAP